MTLNPSDYKFWEKEYSMFTQWALQKDILFLPKELAETESDKQWNLTSKTYILMKRLGQNYDTIMKMSSDERDELFNMEMSLIKEESKTNKEM